MRETVKIWIQSQNYELKMLIMSLKIENMSSEIRIMMLKVKMIIKNSKLRV